MKRTKKKKLLLAVILLKERTKEEGEMKLEVLMKNINLMIKNKPEINPSVVAISEKQGNVKIEDKDNKDYINVHKMMVELNVNNI